MPSPNGHRSVCIWKVWTVDSLILTLQVTKQFTSDSDPKIERVHLLVSDTWENVNCVSPVASMMLDDSLPLLMSQKRCNVFTAGLDEGIRFLYFAP